MDYQQGDKVIITGLGGREAQHRIWEDTGAWGYGHTEPIAYLCTEPAWQEYKMSGLRPTPFGWRKTDMRLA